MQHTITTHKVSGDFPVNTQIYDAGFDIVANHRIETPKTAELISVVASNNLTNKTQTIAAQPDVPRNLVITVTDTTNSVTTGVITITGTLVDGSTLVKTINFTRTGTTTTITGDEAWAKITSIVTSGFATLGGSGDELISVGVGLKLGIPCRGTLVEVFKANVDGADEAVGTVSTANKTITTTTAPNNSRNFEVWYKYTIDRIKYNK